MAQDIRKVNDMESLITYFSEKLEWDIEPDDFYDIDDITYDFEAEDLGLKEEAFAKITSLKQLRPLVDNQKWGIFFVSFDSVKFEVSALRKILSGLIPKRRNSVEHAVWEMNDLLFLCTWGKNNKVTIGAAHFEDTPTGLPQIKMISCEPAVEDFTQVNVFEQRLSKLHWPTNPADTQSWREEWAAAFTVRYRQAIQDSHTLTVRLAEEAQCIRDRILDILEIETKNGYVHLLFEKFQNTLVHDMTETQFADMYAQTIVYGLFSARCMDETQDDFSAAEAVECIPNTNPFLKSLMQECLGSYHSKSKLSFDELEVGNIVDLLMNTRTDAIIADFNRQTGGGREDPVIHFYEEFLTEYDKTQKVQRGVYYTPQPMVNFIVRAVDDILKAEFGIADGLASTDTKTIKVMRESLRKVGGFKKNVEVDKEVPAVQVLDPATGTGTFLRQVILQIFQNFCDARKGMPKAQLQKEWNAYVPEQLLPRLNGFELMMAPYAVAHMKLAMVLKDTGYEFGSENRLQVYLTNSLEEPGNSDGQLSLFDDPLAFESVAANVVKKNSGINIVIGNPPYSTESSNKGVWISELMETYKRESDGITKLKEKNSKPLNDDYIKFIRFGQNILENGSNGILAFINPHGFLDGPIFRGMRSSLLQTFDYIYALDLHGNTNRQETAPDGGKDENVFDIKQGVCILFLVKKKSASKKKGKLYRADLWGTRDEKYSALQSLKLSSIPWIELEPAEPLNLFVLEDKKAKKDYSSGFSVKDLFVVNGTGVLTKRDELCIHFSPEAAFEAAYSMVKEPEAIVKAKYHIPEDVRDWKFEWAKEDVRSSGLIETCVRPISYRPFDNRFVYYTGLSRGFLGWPVHAVMQHMINTDNIALVTARSNKSGVATHFFVSDNIVEYKCGERTTNSSVFPLYDFEDGAFDRKPNFNATIINQIEKILGLSLSDTITDKSKAFSAMDLFGYIYACLYSPSYRETYQEFLTRDFPIIPFPQSKKEFWRLSEIGVQLVYLHLLRTNVDTPCHFAGCDHIVQKVSYDNCCVYINKTSCFENISIETYEYIVGGYQPCNRWLKERRGYELNDNDVQRYCNMIGAIAKTIEIQKQIDL